MIRFNRAAALTSSIVILSAASSFAQESVMVETNAFTRIRGGVSANQQSLRTQGMDPETSDGRAVELDLDVLAVPEGRVGLVTGADFSLSFNRHQDSEGKNLTGQRVKWTSHAGLGARVGRTSTIYGAGKFAMNGVVDEPFDETPLHGAFGWETGLVSLDPEADEMVKLFYSRVYPHVEAEVGPTSTLGLDVQKNLVLLEGRFMQRDRLPSQEAPFRERTGEITVGVRPFQRALVYTTWRNNKMDGINSEFAGAPFVDRETSRVDIGVKLGSGFSIRGN